MKKKSQKRILTIIWLSLGILIVLNIHELALLLSLQTVVLALQIWLLMGFVPGVFIYLIRGMWKERNWIGIIGTFIFSGFYYSAIAGVLIVIAGLWLGFRMTHRIDDLMNTLVTTGEFPAYYCEYQKIDTTFLNEFSSNYSIEARRWRDRGLATYVFFGDYWENFEENRTVYFIELDWKFVDRKFCWDADITQSDFRSAASDNVSVLFFDMVETFQDMYDTE